MVDGLCKCEIGKKFDQSANCVVLGDDDKLLIESKSFDKGTQIVAIEFKDKLEPLTDTKGFSLSLKSNNQKLIPKSIKTSADRKYLYFALDLKDNLEEATLQINNENVEILYNKFSSSINKYFIDYPIEVKISYYFTALDEAVKATGEKAAIGTSIFTIVMLLVSLNMALILIKLFQMLDFFIYLNVDVPGNVKTFISFFDQNIFAFIPNIFEVDASDVDCGMHTKLRELDVSCLSLNNIGNLVIQIIAFYILKSILIVGTECMKTKKMDKYLLKHNNATMVVRIKYRVYSVFKWFNNLFNSTFYWTLLISMEVDLFLGGWIAAKSIGVKKPVNYFANIVIMFLVINYIWLIVSLFRTHYKYIIPTKAKQMNNFS